MSNIVLLIYFSILYVQKYKSMYIFDYRVKNNFVVY